MHFAEINEGRIVSTFSSRTRRCCWIAGATVVWLSVFFRCPPVGGADGAIPSDERGAEGGHAELASPADVNSESDASSGGPTSARAALIEFVTAMAKGDLQRAASVLDFSLVDPPPNAFEQAALAQKVKLCLDRLGIVDIANVSDDPSSEPVTYPPGDPAAPIVFERNEAGYWQFSAETVSKAGQLLETLERVAREATPSTAAQMASSSDSVPLDDDESAQQPDADVVSPLAIAAVPENLKSPRRTMRTLFDALENEESASAVAALDFSMLLEREPELGPFRKLHIANRLKEVIARLAKVDYGLISDKPIGSPFLFPPDQAYQPIKIVRGEDGAWRFSADTVANVSALYELYKDQPILTRPESELPWYERELILGNATWRILTLFGCIFFSLAVGQLLRQLFKKRYLFHQTAGRSSRSLVYRTLSRTVLGLSVLVGLRMGLAALVIDNEVESLMGVLVHVVLAVVVGYVCFRLVDVVVELLRQMASRSGSTLNDMLVPIVSASLRITVVILVILEVATAVSDQPPSTILAGLGASGLAVGLAAQDTIKNLFGSVMIFADRPFELGDRIVVDGHDGPVESVGFRSTRIRTLDGHLVTIPNGEMANRTIHNIGKRPYIRRVLNLRVVPDTPPERLQRVLDAIRELLADHEGMRELLPPRVFLHDFLDVAINIRVIYWYHPPDYWRFCEYGERLNLQIAEVLRGEGVRFAVSTSQHFFTTDAARWQSSKYESPGDDPR